MTPIIINLIFFINSILIILLFPSVCLSIRRRMPTLFRQYSIEYLYYSIDYFSKTPNKKGHLSSETSPEF